MHSSPFLATKLSGSAKTVTEHANAAASAGRSTIAASECRLPLIVNLLEFTVCVESVPISAKDSKIGRLRMCDECTQGCRLPDENGMDYK